MQNFLMEKNENKNGKNPLKNPQEFWAEKAKAIDWFKPFTKS